MTGVTGLLVALGVIPKIEPNGGMGCLFGRPHALSLVTLPPAARRAYMGFLPKLHVAGSNSAYGAMAWRVACAIGALGLGPNVSHDMCLCKLHAYTNRAELVQAPRQEQLCNARTQEL